MPNIILPKSWNRPESEATDHDTYQGRRNFVRTLGLGTIGLTTASWACEPQGISAKANKAAPGDGPLDTIPDNAPRDGLPAPRNAEYLVQEREVTEHLAAAAYNNFYEFSGSSKEIWELTKDYNPFPATLKVRGDVEKEFDLDVADLIREMELEERLYRFRCVEAWSMTIPWTGFPLRKLIEKCKPLSKATHVRFISAKKKKEMPGIVSQSWYKWPYYEGLRMDEATNELAFMATGMYGQPLPKQSGSPIRMVLPWKYGYKGAKAIEVIEFTTKQPKTFWNDLAPNEYDFLSNINPTVPHPRWSQATERFISSVRDVRRVETQLFNGYAEYVGAMYPDEPTG